MTIPPPGFDSPLAVFEAISKMADIQEAAREAALNGEIEESAELEAAAQAEAEDIIGRLGWEV